MEESEALLSSEGISPSQACIAAVNSPSSCTLAGEPGKIEWLHKKLEEKGVFNRILRVNIAFHSALMETIKDDFLKLQCGILLSCMGIIWSNWEV